MNPKLAVEPTVVVPPDIQVAQLNMPNLGDPKSACGHSLERDWVGQRYRFRLGWWRRLGQQGLA